MFKLNRPIIVAIVCIAIIAITPNICISAGKGGPKKPQAQNYLGLSITGQTASYATGDDGNLQKGIPWPDPRFTDNGDGTVTDNLTGLVWLKDANAFGRLLWMDALSVTASLGDGQYGLMDGSQAGDWRMPNIREFESLTDYGEYGPALPANHPFEGVQEGQYWSSTTRNTGGGWSAFVLQFPDGFVLSNGKTVNPLFVWPVRDSK